MKIYDVKWRSENAGPSPKENERIELFLAGCQKAMLGKPCKDCFNKSLWSQDSALYDLSPNEVYETIQEKRSLPYVTIVGGEPFDQMEELATLVMLLSKGGYHTIVFTGLTEEEIAKRREVTAFNDAYHRLLSYVSIIIDGPYEKDKRMFCHDKKDGFHNAIGSTNQRITCYASKRAGDKAYTCLAKDLTGLSLTPSGKLVFHRKEGAS